MRNRVVSQILAEVASIVNLKNVAYERMIDDVIMMNFKIRPLTKDVFKIKQAQRGIVEFIWKLGKIDNLLSKRLIYLQDDERGVIIEHVSRLMHESPQEIAPADAQNFNESLEMITIAVFREENLLVRSIN